MIRAITTNSGSPIWITAPTISGTAVVGSTVSVDNGSNVGAVSYTYAWYRNGLVIGGAVSNSYLLVEADRGCLITCTVTATDSSARTSSCDAVAVGVYTDYYISANGSGSADGLTPSTPFNTTKLISLTLTDRTRLHFNKGDTFYFGDYTFSSNYGSVDAYGTGANPVFTGAVDISVNSWTNEGSGIYSTTLAATPKWIFLNGVASRWAQTAPLLISSISASAANTVTAVAATVNAINSVTPIVGAKFRMMQYNWLMSLEYTVSAYNTGTGVITLSTNHEGGTTGLYFWLFDKQGFISANGDWWFDASISKLYYKSASSPTGLDIKAAYKDVAFTLAATNVSFTNITMSQYGYGGINAPVTGGYATLTGVSITDVKHNAARFLTSNNVTISNCDFRRSGGNGIYITGSNATLTNNYVFSCGMDSNYPLPDGSYRNSGNGTVTIGDNVIDQYNEIYTTAYSGKLIAGANNLVERNNIHAVLSRLRDGGGIYSSGNSTTPTICTNYLGTFRKNFIYDIPTSAEGSLTTEAAVGLYVDNRTDAFTLDQNVVSECTIGILSNWNTRRTTMTNNIVYNCGLGIKYREDATVASSPLYLNNYGNIQTGNVIVSKSNTQYNIEVESYNNVTTFNPYTSNGSANTNYFIQPFLTNICRYRQTSGGSPTDYTLATWRTKMGQDAASIGHTNYLTWVDGPTANTQVVISRNISSTPLVISIGAGYFDKDSNVITGATLAEYSAIIYTK